MIKKQSANNFLDKMNYTKFLGLFLILGLFVSLGSANIAEITSKDVSPKYPDYFETITFSMSVQGDDGIEELGIIVTDPNGEVVKDTIATYDGTDTQIDYTDTLELSSVNPQGEYEVEFYTKDGALTYSEYSIFYLAVEEPSPSWNLISPNDGENIQYPADQTGANVDFETEVTPENNGQVELYIDFDGQSTYPTTPVYTESVSGGTSNTVSTTELISDDLDIDYIWRYVSDATGDSFNSPERSFSVEEVDNPPNINDISTDPTSPQVGESTDVTVDASDDVGLSSFDMYVYDPSGTQVASSSGSISGTTDTFTVSNLFSPQSTGDYSVEVTVEDSNQQTSTDTEVVGVSSESAPSWSLSNPSDGETFNLDPDQSSTSISYDGTVDAEFDGTVSLYRDGTQVGSTQDLVSGGDSYSFSESLSTGNYSYYLEATSDATGETYQSSTYDFEIVQSEEVQPSFNINNPSDGDTETYLNGTGGANVSFTGSVEAPYDMDGNVTISNGVTTQSFVHTSPSTAYEFYRDLSEGNYTYQFNLVSSQTGKLYESNQYSFEVVQTNEQQPDLNLESPTGTRSTAFFDERFDLTVNASSTFDGNAWLYIEYPNGEYVQSVFSALPYNSSEGFDLTTSRRLDSSELEPGTYNIIFEVFSNETGIPYNVQNDLTVTREPVWQSIEPSDESIEVDRAESFKQTSFEANTRWVSRGVLNFQVKNPGESSSWETIDSTDIQEDLRTSVNWSFDSVISSINYREVNDTLVSGNYSARVLFEPESSTETFTSPVVQFNYVADPGLLTRIDRWATSTFGEYGTEILATLFILLSTVYVGVITESGAGILLTALAEATTFSIIGWYPGWVAFLLFMFGIGIGYKLFTSEGG